MVKKDELKQNFSNRLHKAAHDAGVDGRGLARRIRDALKSQGLDMSEPGIWKWLNGASIPDKTNIIALSNWLNVRPEWLEYGDSKDNQVPDKNEWGTVRSWDKNTDLPDDEVEVPFLRDIEFAAGNGKTTTEDYNGFKLRFSKATLRKVGANTDGSGVVCFPARGNSMEPNIPDGTTVAVNTNDKKIVDGKMYAISQNGWNRIKLLYRTGPDTISIRSYNSVEHPTEEKPLNDIEIIGRVFWWSVIDY
ncbi:helix-turn-helix transcriptional regulator [Pectobacterium parmentieri]|uniref:Helix-turn-helix transcriptional regulator n=1 Tax=Pectobacterium parmentieri TaxID=1905730 RepID=A0ABS0RY12_PECPM|nr:XRE family transcriptional regulator [Pectobacterium parmentieri]MBI0554515.1 helix-turn-helix transcriptional regulator [Pectobacterium parmentieri]